MGRDVDAGLKASVLQVGSERETVESEIEHLMHALPCEVGLDKPLVDSAGFPRADVDVAAVRALRQKILSEQTHTGRHWARLFRAAVELT